MCHFQDCLAQLPALYAFSSPSTRQLPVGEVWIGSRKFRLIRMLGEGGYAYVYLVNELPTTQAAVVDDTPYALKKVSAGRH